MQTTKLLETTDRLLLKVLRFICIFCFSLLLVLLAANVLFRNFALMSLYWFDEVVEWAFAWLVFFGAAALWARGEHFKLEWLGNKLKGKRMGYLLFLFLEALSLVFLVIFTYQSFRLTVLARDWTPVLNVSRRFLYICMPISGAIMVGYSLGSVVKGCLAFWKRDELYDSSTGLEVERTGQGDQSSDFRENP